MPVDLHFGKLTLADICTQEWRGTESQMIKLVRRQL